MRTLSLAHSLAHSLTQTLETVVSSQKAALRRQELYSLVLNDATCHAEFRFEVLVRMYIYMNMYGCVNMCGQA